MSEGALPNFFVIGAARAGTTSLYEILSQHPQVFLPLQKETTFFSRERYYELGLEWYVNTYFQNSSKFSARGEASPQYLSWGEKVAPRIAEIDTEKDIKIISMFRDPVKRAYSQHRMEVLGGVEDLSFEDALAKEEERLRTDISQKEERGSIRHALFRGGQYATLLQPFLDFFPRENFHFIFIEDLTDNFSKMMTDLASFLNVESDFAFQQVVSNSSSIIKNRKLHYLLNRPSGGAFYALVRSVLKKTPRSFQFLLKRRIVDINRKPVPKPQIDSQTDHTLRLRFQDEIERLEQITGRNLSHWKTKNDKT